MDNRLAFCCPLCNPSQQNSGFSSKLILKLTRVINMEKGKNLRLNSLPLQNYFRQLIEYFRLEYFHFPQFQNQCSHNKLKDYLTKKLKITHEDLYSLSENIYKSLSKRKFQFELFQKITKNMTSQIFKIPTVKKNQQVSENKNQKTALKQKQLKKEILSTSTLSRQNSQQNNLEIEKNINDLPIQVKPGFSQSCMPLPIDFQNMMGFPLSNLRPEIFSPEQCFLPNIFQFGQYNNTLFSNGLPIFNNYTK